MTPYRHFSNNTTWQRRIRRGGLYVAVAAMIGSQTACSSDNGSDWEQVTVQEATKGVVTTLEETEEGKYSIVDEQVVGSKSDSRIIIRRLNGSVDTMSLDQARSLVQPADTVRQTTYRHHSHGIGHVLWWGSMGYMMGRNFSSPVASGVYNPTYAGGSAFRAGSYAADELRRTSVSRTEMRPARGRSGFFGRSSRSGRGFGG